jgi:hypothetical protein
MSICTGELEIEVEIKGTCGDAGSVGYITDILDGGMVRVVFPDGSMTEVDSDEIREIR